MKHLLISLIIFALALPLAAQDGLEINRIFKGEIINELAIKESLVKGENLAPYKLRVLHTAKFTVGNAKRDKVEAIFVEDTKGRLSDDNENLEFEYRDGHLYYAIVQLPDTKKGLHRYICYQCRQTMGGNDITLVYMEGKARLSDLRKTFKKK